MHIKYMIPYINDERLQYTDKIVLGFLLLLSEYGKNKEIFFSKEILDEMQININTLKSVLKRLEDLKLIKIHIEQNYIYKQRTIILGDDLLKIASEHDNIIKTRKEQKNTKDSTDIPPTDKKSILCNSDSDIRGLFDSVLDEIAKEGKTIPLAYNVGADVTSFTQYYMNKKIYRKTARKWIDNSLKSYRNTESVPHEQIEPQSESMLDYIDLPEDHENE